jgi:hypothetical protein
MSRNSFPAGKDVKIFRRHHKYSIVEPKELGQQSPTAKAPQTKEEAWEPEEGLYPHEEEDISGSTSYEEPGGGFSAKSETRTPGCTDWLGIACLATSGKVVETTSHTKSKRTCDSISDICVCR